MSQQYHINRPIRIAILTVSDTRTRVTDQGGQLIRTIAEDVQLMVTDTAICRDHITDIRSHIKPWLLSNEMDVIITTGGTGISKRDCTIEAIQPYLAKKISGFGELFWLLSFTEDVGSKALLSRALAGVANDKIVFILPGSTSAIQLAMEQLIIPELEHLVFEVMKHTFQEDNTIT